MKSIPLIGLGTWELRGKKCEEVVKMALEIGYRSIDTAHLYENHTEIGQAIAHFPRAELFITSKFFLENGDVEDSCHRALKEMKTDYLDHFLVHWPDRSYAMEPIFETLEKLKSSRKIHGWGVSNCTINHLKDYLKAGFHPEVNQVEFHPYLYQKDLLDFCNKNSIRLVSYRTLGKGALVNDQTIQNIAKKHKKTVPQILLRWCIEKNVPVIPKASSRQHLEEDFAIFDFYLDKEDNMMLDHMDKQKRFAMLDSSDFDY